MIKFFNQHIENFLVKESGYSKEDVILIKDKYKTEITDDLKKGHITTNIGLVSGSVTGTNPKEVAEALKKNLINLDGV